MPARTPDPDSDPGPGPRARVPPAPAGPAASAAAGTASTAPGPALPAVAVTPCITRREQRIFETLPERLHATDPCFVPPIPGSVVALLRGRHPFRRHGRLTPFLAWRGREPMGRIAAIVNETHNRFHGDATGFFGFFDAVDDPEVAAALVAAAEAELAREGRTSLRGPYGPTANDECGLLVEGFGAPPAVLMPYNPPYYVGLYDAVGLEPARDLLAFHAPASHPALERTLPFLERTTRSGEVRARPGDRTRVAQEMETFHDLFNRTLAEEWGFMPVTREDVREGLQRLWPLLDPELVLFLEIGGEPVGFLLAVPDLNELMLRARGSRGWLRTLRFLWYLKTRRPRRARIAAFGVLPAARRRAIDAALWAGAFSRIRDAYAEVELSWVQDVNSPILGRLAAAGLERYKTYRIYEKPIAGSLAGGGCDHGT